MSVVALKIASTPYTYILEWTRLGKRYIGVRYAKNCHPDDLWSKYFTSSKYVHDFVAKHGAPDIILIDKTFNTPQEAMAREQELQYQFDVRNNDSFLNKAVSGVWDHRDPEIVEKHRKAHIGKKHTEEQKIKIGNAHRGAKRPEGTGKRISDANKGRKLTSQQAARCGEYWLGKKQPQDMIEKRRIKLFGNKSRIGQKNSPESNEKRSLANAGTKHKIVTCPHCDVQGSITGMSRWHFDGCKEKPKNGVKSI